MLRSFCLAVSLWWSITLLLSVIHSFIGIFVAVSHHLKSLEKSFLTSKYMFFFLQYVSFSPIWLSPHISFFIFLWCCSLLLLFQTLSFFFCSCPFLPLPLLLLSSLALLVCFGGCTRRESRKLLQPLSQFQRVEHRQGHQRGRHHFAVRRVLWTQERRTARSVSVGGHQLRCGPAHPNVHSNRPWREDGGLRHCRPQW